MKLFRRTSRSWPPAWSFDAGAIIWRFLFDGDGRIVGEARDPERKHAWYFCLDEHSGTPFWNDLRMDEPWWVGIEGIASGRLYLHGYRKPDMPQHLGITAIDIPSGRQLWHNGTLTFLLAVDADVYAMRETFGGMRFFRLSPTDGAVVEELGEDMERISALRQRVNEENLFRGYRYPQPYRDDHPHYPAISGTVHDIVRPQQVTGDLDVLFEAPLLCVSWHETADSAGEAGLRQCFEARDMNSGRTVLRETILDAAAAPGMDSFFLKDDQLMYIKNRSILTAHDLNGVPA